MTIVEALKSIYNKWTGKTSEGNTIEEVLGELNDDYTPGSGGGSLPTPGTAGNVLTSTGDAWESAAPSASLPAAGADGNVLTADKGEWVSAALPANAYPVTITSDGEGYSANKTLAEINTAYQAGKEPIGLFNDDGTINRCRCVTCDADVVAFSYGGSMGDFSCVTFIGSDEGWYRFDFALPAPSDNGKILGVDNGSAAWVSPSALSNAPLYVSISQTGNTLSTDKTATEITTALDAGKAVVLRQKIILGAGTAEEVTVWSEKTIVGVYHIAATGYELMYVEYDGDTDTWSKFTMTAATGADVFSYTGS